MTDTSSRNKANKRKGAGFEIDLVQYLRDQGLDAERLTKTGRDDEGDAVIKVPDLAVVVEAKNEKTISLSRYVTEAHTEACNWVNHRSPAVPALVLPVAVVKRRQNPISKSYVVMEADYFARLLIHLQQR